MPDSPVPASVPAVEFDRVCVNYGVIEALHDATLTIPHGTSVAIIGPNGSGKSTLLGLVSGLVQPSSGTVRVFQGNVSRSRRRIAHVLQSTSVHTEVPMTVVETIRLGTYASLGLLRLGGRRQRTRITEAARRLRIEDLLQRQLPELSGGQRQRVFLAQGLVQDADILLLDEPIAGLDLPSQEIISNVIREERGRGRTVIMTTHDVGSAATADMVVLVATDVIAAGTPHEVLTPDNLSTAFGGHLHLLPDGTLVLDDPAHHGDASTGSLHSDNHPESERLSGDAGVSSASTPG
jgi:ABC-type Mn2+/Zn2+ transport system ATPase subunit